MKSIAPIASVALVAALLVMVPAALASADTGVCAGPGTAGFGGPGDGLYYPTLGPKKTLPFTFGGWGVTCTTDKGYKFLTAAGTVNGYCGLSYGRGSAFGTSPHDFQFVDIGGLFIITGEITGAMRTVPGDTPGNSCLPPGGGAWWFIVAVGVAKIHGVPVIPPPVEFPPSRATSLPTASPPLHPRVIGLAQPG